jgi:hypothetical protein
MELPTRFQQALEPGEKILFVSKPDPSKTDKPGTLIVTDNRVLHFLPGYYGQIGLGAMVKFHVLNFVGAEDIIIEKGASKSTIAIIRNERMPEVMKDIPNDIVEKVVEVIKAELFRIRLRRKIQVCQVS